MEQKKWIIIFVATKLSLKYFCAAENSSLFSFKRQFLDKICLNFKFVLVRIQNYNKKWRVKATASSSISIWLPSVPLAGNAIY